MSRYGFVVSASRPEVAKGKVVYSARMRHLDVIRGEQLFKEFGEYMAMNPTLAKNLVNGLGGYIKQQLLHGYKLDFGVFKVGLTIRGGFDAANDKFDPEKNTVCVSLTPSVELKKAVAKMQPENLTALQEPILDCAFCEKYINQLGIGKLVCRVECGMNGAFPVCQFTSDDDGVWLEDDNGKRVAKAKILSVDSTRLEFIINEDVLVGRYRLFIGSRAKGQAAVATDSVPVEIVSAPYGEPADGTAV